MELLAREPIVTAAHVGDALGTTPRTDLNFLVELEGHGLVENLVRRRIYRACPPRRRTRTAEDDALTDLDAAMKKSR